MSDTEKKEEPCDPLSLIRPPKPENDSNVYGVMEGLQNKDDNKDK